MSDFSNGTNTIEKGWELLKGFGAVLSGFVPEKEAKANVINVLGSVDLRKVKDQAELNALIVKSVKNYIFKATRKNPIILPVTMVV